MKITLEYRRIPELEKEVTRLNVKAVKTLKECQAA